MTVGLVISISGLKACLVSLGKVYYNYLYLCIDDAVNNKMLFDLKCCLT